MCVSLSSLSPPGNQPFYTNVTPISSSNISSSNPDDAPQAFGAALSPTVCVRPVNYLNNGNSGSYYESLKPPHQSRGELLRRPHSRTRMRQTHSARRRPPIALIGRTCWKSWREGIWDRARCFIHCALI